MIVAIASGKGGTGKTTVSASLVSMWQSPVVAVDLDVEEPNLHLFLNPVIEGREKATIEIPKPDESKCSYCRKCIDICQFKAVSVLGEVLLTFPEMCHGCGGCIAVCPEGALTADRRELGEISWGQARQAKFIMGALRVGEAMSPPLMRAVKRKLSALFSESGRDVLIDAPPGVSCPAVNAVMDSDVIVLVTEPTPFGLYDLQLAHRAFTPLNIPMAAVVNRAGLGTAAVYDYCREHGLDILAEIPYDRKVAEMYARGGLVHELSRDHRDLFDELCQGIQRLVRDSRNAREAANG